MYAMSFVRANADALRTGMRLRQRDPGEVDHLLAVDVAWKEVGQRVNELRAQRNQGAHAMGERAKSGAPDPAAAEGLARLRDQIAELEREAKRLAAERDALLLLLPQIPHASVPVGASAAENVVVAEHPSARPPVPDPRPHDELAHALNLLDEERGVKVAGEGFFVLWGDLARLEHALIRFMRELHAAHGFEEVVPPILINSASMTGTGQLPKFAEDSYHIEKDDLWLAPTAEVPVTNLFRDEVFLAEDLPYKLEAYTPCFRREAAGHGVETRGIARVHQFDKVELVVFARPEDSYAQLTALREEAELVVRTLELPYRVLNLCTGDLPDKAAQCFDIELWAPGSKRWLEVSSISNFEAYQATRANIRWRTRQDAKAEPVHTLNASGTALPRLVIALLENGQRADGSIELPGALRPFLGGQSTLRAMPRIGERELARGRHRRQTAP
jgi:seryl-tRNA synthetase